MRLHDQVALTVIAPDETIPAADLIILPGSKNVRADLQWLRSQGWEKAIHKHLRYGGKLIGICGGLQMLGEHIHDPHGIEAHPGSSHGLGLLDLQTTLEKDKQLRHGSGTLCINEEHISGYEIHAGITTGKALKRPAIKLADRDDGAISDDDQIMGSYFHGLFETPGACKALLQWVGLEKPRSVDYKKIRKQSFDRLAVTFD